MKINLLIINLFFVCFLEAQLSDSTLSYNERFELAMKHFQNRRYQLAEQGFKNILIEERNFEDPVSHFMLATSQFHQGQNDRLQKDLRLLPE